ncbi:MAG TPA: hypothetical protein VL500_05015 [Candidatus Eisenbacteria bacterium]|nr:hypothetical protein [Candidatus Eisenbacteria bacterium]
METTPLRRFSLDVAKGTLPVALFAFFCGLTAVTETYGLITGLLAMLSVGALTPATILHASSFRVACVAAALPAALVCAALWAGSWFVLPIAWVLMMTVSASLAVLRLRVKDGEERWSDTLLSMGAALLAMVFAGFMAFSGSETCGTLILVLLIGLVAIRRKYGPPPELA